MSRRNPGYKEIFSEFDIFGFHNNYHKWHKRMRDYVIYFRTGSSIPYVQINGVETQLSVLIGGNLYMGVLAAPCNYPAANEGEYWRVSTAGALGAGPTVEVGDQVICIATNAGGNHATVGTSFMIVQKNMVPCDLTTLQTGTDDSAFVTANVLADAFNQGAAFTDNNSTLRLSGGILSQIDIAATNASAGIHFSGGVTTGKLIDYTNITTKTSGFLFRGEMNTSILDDTTIVDEFKQSCKHDGVHADTLIGKKLVWSGDVPNTTVASTLSLMDLEFTGTYGYNSGTAGGTLCGLDINMQGEIADTAAVEVGLKVQVSTTRTAAASVYGVYVSGNAGTDAGIYALGSNTQISVASTADQTGMNITNTGMTSNHALQITALVNSASVQVINVDIAPSAALTGSEAVIGCDIAVMGNGADADGTSWTCYNAKIEGINACGADFAAYTVDMVGTLNTADTHNGLVINFGQTMNNAGATVYGTRISTSSFTHTLGNWYGHYINQTYTTVTGASIAIGIDSILSSNNTKAIEITASSATATATLINTMKITQAMSGASDVNMAEVAQFIFESNIQVGNWANAVAAKMDFKTNGYMTGMAGVVCAELDLPLTATASGTYTCFQGEINYPGVQDVPVSAMAINVWGAGAAAFDDYGLLFDINGVTEGAGHFLDAIADHAATHTIKLRIGGVTYYLLATDSLV